ncbi:MAG TPA: peptidylprolyl isomerase, partial [Gemmatimonadales bacterium]|nr:peptidylprolyl isomerase [Gemmatimonadales bacterium]
MRRLGFAIAVSTALTGCSSFREVFTSHAETAARVGDHQLKSAYVADIIGRVGGGAANPQASEVIAGIWVDLQLFGDRIARGTLKPDSALFERLLWPQLAQNRTAAWHDSLVARRAAPTAASADSIYNAGELRLFQHILIQPTGTTAGDSAKAKAQAERLLPQARSDFGKTATEHSADLQNKKDNGYLPVTGKGSFVAEFDTVAWKLQPGQLSGVVRSSFGYHIIRRPPLSEVRDRFVANLKQANLARQDSIYFAELTSRNQI